MYSDCRSKTQLFVQARLRGIHCIPSSSDLSDFLAHYQMLDALFLPCRCSAPKHIGSFLLYSLVGHLDVTEEFCMVCRDDARIDIGA